ncbi:MAG: pilus assembly protein N-terminal domain-containing protein [Myxococcaceae bacterium]
MLTTAALALLVLAADPVRMTPGSQEVLKVGTLSRVGVGDPSICDVTPTGKGELLITARQKGRTTLTLWTGRGIETRQVVVDDGKTSDLGKLIKSTVNPSLRVEEYNGQTIVDGTLDSPDELRRLRQVVGDDGNVKILAKLDPKVLPAVAQNINAALAREGIKDAHVTCIGQMLLLEGSVADEREMRKAQLIADAYAGAVVRR